MVTSKEGSWEIKLLSLLSFLPWVVPKGETACGCDPNRSDWGTERAGQSRKEE